MGRILIAAGVALIVAGLFFTFGGRLPGDIYVQGKNGSFYFPVVTCILLSVLLSVLVWILRKL